MLKVKKLSFSYGKKQVLKDISLSLGQGEIASLIGASGSGKTTLFKLLTGILNPTEGTIETDGDTYPAYMTQQDLLLPWRTVLKNVMLPAELGKKSSLPENMVPKALSLLDELGMKNCSEMFPDELSGGMRQRVSLARALLQSSKVLLLDEPFSSLDLSLREQLYDLLRRIQQEHMTTMLMVTHDFRDALTLSDHIFFLDEGSIKKQWTISDEERNDPKASAALIKDLREHMLTLINNSVLK